MQTNMASRYTPFESGLQPRGGAQQSQIKKKKTWVVGLAALLLLVLVGSGLTARILLSRPSITTAAEETVTGHVSFIKDASAQNYNAVQIDITHVSDLPPGMGYYAWIVAQNSEQGEHTFPPHWELTVSQHAIHTPPLTFPGIANLYVPNSLFLITKEQTDNPPIVPGIDPSARLYYAPMTSATLDLKQCPATNTAAVCFN